MSVQKRISLVITGKVQGVGYRYSVKLKAESLAISGYVRNQLDGSVFVTARVPVLPMPMPLSLSPNGMNSAR